MKLSDIMGHAELSMWSEVSMAIFLGVFVLILIRVLRAPKGELSAISERAMQDSYDTNTTPAQGAR